jgi:type I restriction enzyme R subunit
MSLNESIVEDAALEWFLLRSDPLNYGGQVGELGYAALHGPHLAPGEPAAERSRSAAETDEVNSFGEVVLVGRLREAIRRLNPAIPEEARATDKESLSVQNPSKGG